MCLWLMDSKSNNVTIHTINPKCYSSNDNTNDKSVSKSLRVVHFRERLW